MAGQVLRDQWIDSGVGDTFWVQSTAAPNTAPGLVTIHDNAPTDDRWNYAAVEITPAPGTPAAAGSAQARFASTAAATSAAPQPSFTSAPWARLATFSASRVNELLCHLEVPPANAA
jgi:hypothetical protein